MSPAEFIEDPNWFGFIPDMEGSVRSRHLPAHEDCSPLDVESVACHLRRGGTLGGMEGYEERPGQIDMSRAIAEAFNARSHLMVEAGTGVGKSLAYLVPSVLWAWTNDTPVIISTATRNLQSQLIGSDIPRVLRVLGENARSFKVALLKGRANYICLRALGEYFASGFWTLPDSEQTALGAFIDWLRHTSDGDLDSIDTVIPRSQITCQGDECGGARCPFHRKCFVYKARRRAAEAHLVVVNHSLVLADATAPGGGILPAYGRLILDEAHNLEDIATEYLGSELSLPELGRILRRLLRHAKDLSQRARELLGAAKRLLTFLGKILPDGREAVRFRVDGFYWKDRTRLACLQADFERPLIELVHLLHDRCDGLEDLALAQKLSSAAASLLAFANSSAFVIRGEQPTHAYWVERMSLIRGKSYVRLVAAPISVADDLRKVLYDVRDSVVLCSATLRVGNDFRYMAHRLGCVERFMMITAESPFDYFRQALVLAPDCLPDPATRPTEYADALAAMMRDLFAATRGRALVLFTSYEMMNAVAARASYSLADAGIDLLVQGEGLSREAMTRRLKENSNTVIFGAQSFWEGVDVSGDALSCVVLAKLPFDQVGDPMFEARSERVKLDGRNSFVDYALPEAVIRFRQGFGRLIRTKSDRGVVVVTDPRIVTKSYGARFRQSIPATIHTVTELPDLLRRIGDFIS